MNPLHYPLQSDARPDYKTQNLENNKPTRGKLTGFTGHLAHFNPAPSVFVWKAQTKPDFPPLDTRFPSFLRLVGEAREVWLISQTALPSVA